MLLAAGATPSTTFIPTWLVILVPILAALVSGAAGVAGALLGGRAATRTAERNAALARQDEQRRWNRERSEKAYVTLLDRRNQLVEIKRAWDEGDPDGLGHSITEIKEHVRDVFEAEQSLEEALAVVELVGTAEAGASTDVGPGPVRATSQRRRRAIRGPGAGGGSGLARSVRRPDPEGARG